MANKEYRKALETAYMYFDRFDYYGSHTYNCSWKSNEMCEISVLRPVMTKQQRNAYDNGKSKLYVSELKNCNHKARIAELYNGSKMTVYLISYNTAVAKIDTNGHFIKLWHGYSATTAKHIATFMQQYGMKAVNKKEWLLMPLNKWNGETEVA